MEVSSVRVDYQVTHKEMKEILGMTVAVILGTTGLLFAGYIAFAGIAWITTDPLKIVPPSPEPKVVETKESPDFQLCRDKGGIPIASSWDGTLKRCEFIK